MKQNEDIGKDKLLAEALPEGVAILDAQGRLVWWNTKAQQLLALHSSYRDRHIDRVLHKKIYFALQSESSLQVVIPNQPNALFKMQLRPYWGEEKLLVIQDITLTQKLESMRRDFVANVSHELRTPLTVFQGYLELLKDTKDLSSVQLSNIVSQMDGQASRMHQLVEDLLLLSRLESVEPDPERRQKVPVASLLKNIRDDAVSLSGSRRHQFILELDPNVMLLGDPEELRSAFSNLVYNAVHYTPDKGKITLRLYEKEGKKYMEVEDTGIGIAEKHLPRITQRFYRVDKARTSKAGGTGLGLALVKHILLRHHGDLEIESQVGKGSLFRCVFTDESA